jgi:N-acetylglucosamine kinase-like BadF-type ATPase
MILLADSGSTKTEWCLAEDENVVETFFTEGINSFFQSRKDISRIIRLQLPPSLFKVKLTSIHYYGVGCWAEEQRNIIKASLESQFRTPATVEMGLLGAARSLFRDKPGIACILGTSSNSCFYDGKNIAEQVNPLGFILGDEGSAAALGKVFLADCLKNIAPKELREPFIEKYKIDVNETLYYLYTKQYPHRLLSVFSFFLKDYLDHPYVYDLVYTNLKSFFERNVMQYPYQDYPVRFVGAVANLYADIIMKISRELRLNVDMINENSIDQLVHYHANYSV